MRHLVKGSTALALAVAFAVAGCGGSGSSDKQAAPVKPAPSAVASRPQLDRPGSPGAAIVSLWQLLRVDALPDAAALYDGSAIAGVGTLNFGAALQDLPKTYLTNRLSLVSSRRTGRGSLVVLKAKGQGGSQTGSYSLRRRGGRWVIVYDSLLDSAIARVVAKRVQGGSGSAGEPSRAAQAAGDNAAARYRASALETGGVAGRKPGQPAQKTP